MVDGVDRFLLKQLEASILLREQHWQRDLTSPKQYAASLEPNRRRLAHILGVRDPRTEFDAPQLIATTRERPLAGQGQGFDVLAVRWPVFGHIEGEGLLLVPRDRAPVADVVALPDADQTPEQLVGLAEGIPPESQYARRLAESGCRVLVPVLISRKSGVFDWGPRQPRITSREILYRSAFELGRHLIGYELQKVLAGVDWFTGEAGGGAKARIGVIGWGEGALLAMYAGALDTRIDVTLVSGYFDSRQNLWQEPIDRNVFGLLEQFGDAELASMIAPRGLVVEAARGVELALPPETQGAPARLVTPAPSAVQLEWERARSMVKGLEPAPAMELVLSGDGTGPPGTEQALRAFLKQLDDAASLAASGSTPRPTGRVIDPLVRQRRQMRQIDNQSQQFLGESADVRKAYFSKLKTDTLDDYNASVSWYREQFRDEVIGRFDQPRRKPHPRSRMVYDQPGYVGYEVVLDVFPDVFAYGVLLVPKDIQPGERRPVVVCQHGLEGRPQDLSDPAVDHPAYHRYACQLAERGFVTFAPQNPYIFRDRFRTLQRKANPLKKTLFSVIVPQHQQIVDWLASLEFVDPERIGFYGLSYGGKTAMRVPALVQGYCLSICSADFNEWVWKNASTRTPYSSVWTGEYEIFEFDLGSTFNYAEMAALIAPRPFMVERGHFDGVSSDERVAYEFARVRHLYAARLKIPERCQIEWFAGPHTIHGVGTFDFLHKHLNWPKPQESGP
jgi:dienelactone hydrolase